jgi:CubicO group peptidase (beta-lactamase class C family)
LVIVLSAGIVAAVQADQIPMAKPESVGLSSVRLERLAQAIRPDVETGRMPGAVVAIARKGKLAYYEAFGFADAAARTPLAKDSIFSLASMTKPLAAVATLMLLEQGDLLLNDPVGNHLPALKDMKVATPTGEVVARRQPTLQDMLRHTAGVSYGNRGDSPLHKRYGEAVRSANAQSSTEFLRRR